jgi:hypothetical protein
MKYVFCASFTSSKIVVHVDGVRRCLNCGHGRPYCPSPRWYMSIYGHGGMISTGENRIIRRKTCPSAILSATNPAWTEPGANLGFRREDQRLTNHLSHGTAFLTWLIGLHCLCFELLFIQWKTYSRVTLFWMHVRFNREKKWVVWRQLKANGARSISNGTDSGGGREGGRFPPRIVLFLLANTTRPAVGSTHPIQWDRRPFPTCKGGRSVKHRDKYEFTVRFPFIAQECAIKNFKRTRRNNLLVSLCF